MNISESESESQSELSSPLKTLSFPFSRQIFLGGMGLIILGMFVGVSKGTSSNSTNVGIYMGTALFLALVGLFMIIRSMGMEVQKMGTVPPMGNGDAEYVVRQLSRNYEILRTQTNQGFLLSTIFMAIGLLVIIISLLSPSLGLETEGVENLGILAGIITEFISGSALFLYRLNFARLNETSDKLDVSWKVLAAYRLTTELPEEQKAVATMNLIAALIAPKQ